MKLLSSRLPLVFLLAAFGSANGQASVVAGSGSTNTANYTPGAGYNRVLVVAVTGEVASIGTIASITYGTQALTSVRTQVQGQLRTDIFYLNEAGIRTGGYCGASFTVTYNATSPTNRAFYVMTLRDVDQTTPVAGALGAGFNSGTIAAGTAIATGNMTGAGVGDLVVYASGCNNNRTHTPPGTYTEQNEQVVATTVAQAVATRAITVAATENPTATWSAPNSALNNVGVVFNGITAVDPTLTYTFYSRATGAWDANTTWSLSETDATGAVQTGVWPRRGDNVIIKSGHNVTIDAINDNKTCGVSATSLGIANVGQGSGGGVAFDNSATAAFYQTGNVTIRGTLTVSGGGNSIMTSGTTTVVSNGNFSAASNYYNLGYFEVQPSAAFTTFGNFIITGSSTSLINAAITITNDFGIDWTNATICGSGIASLSLGPGSAILYTNGATIAQMCSSFSVACPGGGCTGATFPASGTTVVITGNSGPAGIGNSTFNRLWLKADDLSLANGARVTSWADASGNSLTAVANANPSLDVTIQPQFVTPSRNGLPSVLFDGGDYLTLGSSAVLNLVGLTDPMTFFSVHNVGANATGTFLSKAINNPADARHYQFQIDGTNQFTAFVGGSYNQGTASVTGWAIGTFVVGTTATSLNSFVNDVAQITNGGVGNTTTTADVLVGARRGTTATTNANFGFALTGNIAELIFYRATFNLAQRIIMHNYLSAKYDIGISVANNLYTGDNAGYDYEVAGIGQASDGSSHRDAKGSGPVRMWNPSAMANGEFLIWGHNGLLYNRSTTSLSDVDGTVIKERLIRIWRLTETGDVGTVNISFDIAALGGTVIGSNLRLLIDRDGNFATNDVAPIVGSYSNNVVTFTGVNFQANDLFTLGNTDNVAPLPIELLSFRAVPERDAVRLSWETLSERNNDFFTIERSLDGEAWADITSVKGAGTFSGKRKYSAVDESPVNGLSYYRLRQTDFDGAFKYSDVQRVQLEGIVRLDVYPNPSKGSYTITASDDLTSAEVRVLDVLGRPVAVTITRQPDSVSVDPGYVTSGIYFIQVSTPSWNRTVRVVRE